MVSIKIQLWCFVIWLEGIEECGDRGSAIHGWGSGLELAALSLGFGGISMPAMVPQVEGMNDQHPQFE